MALIPPVGTQFENPEPGSYLARCYGFVDLGTQLHKGNMGKEDWLQRDVRFLFEMPLYPMTGCYKPENKGKPFVTSIALKFSLDPKANMRKMIKGWRGKDLTLEEAKCFIVKKLLGAAVRISLVEKGDYVNIDSFSKATPEEVKSLPAPVNKHIYFSLDPEEFDEEVFNSLGEKTRNKIILSPEYDLIRNPKAPVQPAAPYDDNDSPNEPF